MIIFLIYYVTWNIKLISLAFFLPFSMRLLENLKLYIRLTFEAPVVFLLGSTGLGHASDVSCKRLVGSTNSWPTLAEVCFREMNSLVLWVFFHEQRQALSWRSQELSLESCWYYTTTARAKGIRVGNPELLYSPSSTSSFPAPDFEILPLFLMPSESMVLGRPQEQEWIEATVTVPVNCYEGKELMLFLHEDSGRSGEGEL